MKHVRVNELSVNERRAGDRAQRRRYRHFGCGRRAEHCRDEPVGPEQQRSGRPRRPRPPKTPFMTPSRPTSSALKTAWTPHLITKWDGPGITSSTARTANVAQGFDLTGLGVIRNSDLDITTGIPGSSYTTFSGQPVTPDDVLVKYTYIGDANLSGAVSFDDYVGMDNAFFGLIPNLGWATGDINFDGVINFDDYSKVDQAFFFQGRRSIQEALRQYPSPVPG